MFNFSANHLFLLSRTEYPSYAVFLLQDGDTQRVYRLYDFTKTQLIRPHVAYCVAGKVNSADKLRIPMKWGTDSGASGAAPSQATLVTVIIAEVPQFSQDVCTLVRTIGIISFPLSRFSLDTVPVQVGHLFRSMWGGVPTGMGQHSEIGGAPVPNEMGQSGR